MHISEHVVEREAARVVYEVSGPSTGPVIILGHSLLCDTAMWRAVVPQLCESFRVINVEARGHGRSTAERPFSLEDLADDWLSILDAERVDRAVACGLSMGGMTAMRLALDHPLRVDRLLLLATSADVEPMLARLRSRAMAEVVRRFGHIELFGGIIARLMFGEAALSTRSELKDELLERIYRHDPQQLYLAVRAVIDRGSIVHRLPAISCPTTVMVGSGDRAIPPATTRRIADLIPRAQVREIAEAGHLLAIESPEAVVDEALTLAPEGADVSGS